jgi:hypothetical protein
VRGQQALSRAVAPDEECYRAASNHLLTCAVYHGRKRVGSSPFPQDITLRNRVSDAMQKAQPGTPLLRLYESLVRRAEDNIREARARDEEMDA